MEKLEPLIPGHYNHIYNKGINGEDLFKQERNYFYFLEKYALYIYPIAATYAYCLLKNHFHLLVKIREEPLPFDMHPDETSTNVSTNATSRAKSNPSRKFSHLFNCYTQSINKEAGRTGGLFESPFERKIVSNKAYFNRLTAYIHKNPQLHGFVDDFRDWPHSSYHAYLSHKPTKLEKQGVIAWFGNANRYTSFHQSDFSMVDLREVLFDEI